MDGSTIIEPVEGLYFDTRFRAFFLLAARDRGAWRPALRYDRVYLRNLPEFPDNPYDEDGHAWTLALNWRPREQWRLTGEWLRIDSNRGQRLFEGLTSRQREQLFQLSLRYQF
jgi:phosphate-selective porin